MRIALTSTWCRYRWVPGDSYHSIPCISVYNRSGPVAADYHCLTNFNSDPWNIGAGNIWQAGKVRILNFHTSKKILGMTM